MIRPVVWYTVVPYLCAIVIPVIAGGALKTRSVRLNRQVRPGGPGSRMNIAVVSEVRFCRVPDGSVWADASPYPFWTRYLDEFNSRDRRCPRRAHRCAASGYAARRRPRRPPAGRSALHGLAGVHAALARRASAVRPLVYEPDALILRLGSLLALGLQGTLLRSGKPTVSKSSVIRGTPLRRVSSTRRCEAWSGGSSPAVSSGCAPRLPARPTSRRSRSSSAIRAREMRGPCPTSSSRNARRSRRTTRASS